MELIGNILSEDFYCFIGHANMKTKESRYLITSR